MEPINVTKTFLPPIQEFQAYLEKIWENTQLTNQGPYLQQLEKQLQKYLKVKYIDFVTNGTLALQIALRLQDVANGEVITTPFTYVATTSSILWEHSKPVFVDIDPKTLCIDAEKIEAAITSKTKAIMPVHVFGNPCDVEKIDAIGKKHNIPVIYDAAHAFGVTYKGKSLFDYGDISMCSLHATKIFHAIEGGLLIMNNKDTSTKIGHMKKFGHLGDEHFMLGINAKATELQAVMGLCNMKYIDKIIEDRKNISKLYDKNLAGKFERPTLRKGTTYNYAYYPIIFQSEKQLKNAIIKLKDNNIFPRRYFYPSLNTLSYIKDAVSCPISEDIASRIACLPLYSGLDESIVNKISRMLLA
jgi:dTDP-4-amino-4,6-dideoxygalactose transaminase